MPGRPGSSIIRCRLAAVSSVCALAEWFLAEREPAPVVHAASEAILDRLAGPDDWGADYVSLGTDPAARDRAPGLDLTQVCGHRPTRMTSPTCRRRPGGRCRRRGGRFVGAAAAGHCRTSCSTGTAPGRRTTLRRSPPADRAFPAPERCRARPPRPAAGPPAAVGRVGRAPVASCAGRGSQSLP